MGSWSESCGFSGMEIAYGDPCYVMMIDKPKVSSLNDQSCMYYQPTSIPLRGTYKDYGQLHIDDDEKMITLFNEQTGLALSNGDDFDHEDLVTGSEHSSEHWGRRWWIRGEVFDWLDNLEQDFGYVWIDNESIKAKNLGHFLDMHFGYVIEKLEAAKKSFDELSEIKDDQERLIREYMIEGLELREILGGHRSPPVINQKNLIGELKMGEDYLYRIEGWKRSSKITNALSELRKTLHPNESIGPQHGGQPAMKQFCKAMLDIIEIDQSRWDDE